MALVLLVSCVLVVITTIIHYEVLSWLNTRLADMGGPQRTKLIVVMLTAYLAHAFEAVLYAFGIHGLVVFANTGAVINVANYSFWDSLHISAQCYTSLGFGNVHLQGPVLLLAGIEGLNGLLLVAWTASFTYLSMERYWQTPKPRHNRRHGA